MMNSADLKKVWENNRQLREEVEGYYIELEKIDYLNYEMDYDNKQYDNLNEWIEEKTEEIKDKALEFLNAITEIDESYLFEYFEDFYFPEYIENDCDYYIVDNVLYEKQVKCYA